MKVMDKQFITLSNKGEKIKIVVYLKEVEVRGGGKVVRPFCRIVDPKKVGEYELFQEDEAKSS